jgi:hypothetical protein
MSEDSVEPWIPKQETNPVLFSCVSRGFRCYRGQIRQDCGVRQPWRIRPRAEGKRAHHRGEPVLCCGLVGVRIVIFRLCSTVAGQVPLAVAFIGKVEECAANNFAFSAAGKSEVICLVDAADR